MYEPAISIIANLMIKLVTHLLIPSGAPNFEAQFLKTRFRYSNSDPSEIPD